MVADKYNYPIPPYRDLDREDMVSRIERLQTDESIDLISGDLLSPDIIIDFEIY